MTKSQALELAISELHGKPDMLTAIRELRIAQMKARRDEREAWDAGTEARQSVMFFGLIMLMFGGLWL